MRKRPNSPSATAATGTAAGGPPGLGGNIRRTQRRQHRSPSRRRRSSAGTPTPSSGVLCPPAPRASSQATSQEAYCSSAAAAGCSIIGDPQFLLEPLHRPQPQHAGCVRRPLQPPPDLLEGVLPLVAQEDDLAVVVGLLSQGAGEEHSILVGNGLLARGRGTCAGPRRLI